jgi:AAA domain
MKLSDKQATKVHHVLVFGPPKSGKTELVGKLSSDFNILYIDMENGTDTLLKFPKEWKERIEVISLRDTRSYPIAIETCLKMIKGGKGSICETHGKWICPVCQKSGASVIDIELNALLTNTIVVFDSITQLTDSAIANITKDKSDDYKLERDDWGNLGKLLNIFFSHIQQAPFNVVCISHETEVEMTDGTKKIVPTAGTNNYSRTFAKYFDEVTYCHVVNKTHKVGSATSYTNKILTGSRTGMVLENHSDPYKALVGLFKNDPLALPKESINTSTQATKSVTDLKSLVANFKKK